MCWKVRSLQIFALAPCQGYQRDELALKPSLVSVGLVQRSSSVLFLCLLSVCTVTLVYGGGKLKCSAEAELGFSNGFAILPLHISCIWIRGHLHESLRSASLRVLLLIVHDLTSMGEFRGFLPSLDLRYTGGVTTFALLSLCSRVESVVKELLLRMSAAPLFSQWAIYGFLLNDSGMRCLKNHQPN